MLSAVENVVDKIQEVTGLKGDDKPDKPKDADQAGDQGDNGGDEASPEFTTTSKVTEPSGKEVVQTVHDDVPLPADDPDTDTRDQHDTTTKHDKAPKTDQTQTPSTQEAPPAPKTAAAAPATAAAGTTASSDNTPQVPARMNKLRNRGGGAQALPSTPHKWKKEHTTWYPDAAGVLHPPNFHINKRRTVSWQ